MSEIDLSTNPLIQSLSVNKNEAPKEDELGQDAFLRLMIAQLENQDPLSPQENGEFIAQLAQFSSVEGITNLNNSVTDLVSEFRSNQALEASALVGRKVETGSNKGRLIEDSFIQGTIELPASTSNVKLIVKAQNGAVVRVDDLGQQGQGDVPFAWGGLSDNDEMQPPGFYTIEASALINGETVAIPVGVAANVNSVSLGADRNMTLDVDGIGPVSLDDVKRFL